MKVLLTAFFMSFITFGLPKHYVSTNNISVGDTFMYTIELPSELVASIEPSFNGLEIIDSTIDRRPTATAHQFQVQVFSVEALMIPTVSLTAINGLEPMELEPIYFNLVSLLSATANKLNDIAPVFGIWYVNWLVLTVIITLLVIGGMTYLAWKRKQEMKQAILEEQQDPPIIIALRSIKELKNKLSNDPLTIKRGYFQLTEIFCTYITNRTNINVLDATTVEMNRLLKNANSLPTEVVQHILAVSQRMDHYKFSQNPSLDLSSIEDIMNKIITVIKRVES